MAKDGGSAGQKILIGCCGAYCKTCRPLKEGYCKGCKLGYAEGKRDIKAAKCKMKACCFGERGLETCADCPDYPACEIVIDFHGKKGYKYRKYKESMEFIRKNGYAEFLERAGKWKCAYGKL
ncbi:MAG: DUF3795 domain-containing protein [Candidatus ainarchaeum sp.]|nr:DUF3795 domain-containing protein [Candidatus ainarchaeum sp.]